MPRQRLGSIPGLYFHVMARGNNRSAIFQDEKDYGFYLKLLRRAAKACRVEVHAYCLMPNHIHLLARSLDAFLPECMRRVHGAYGRWFNDKYERVGHLFQGRYQAKVIVNLRYLFEVGRYIHMNPVAAGIVARPEDYPWSSLRIYLRGRRSPLVRRDMLASPFRETKAKGFYSFTVARRPEVTMEATFGQSEWYSAEEGEPAEDPPPSVPISRDAFYWMKRTADALNIGIDRLINARRDPSLGGARALAALVLRRGTPLKLKDIAEYLGYCGEKSVANAIVQAGLCARQEERIKKLLESFGLL